MHVRYKAQVQNGSSPLHRSQSFKCELFETCWTLMCFMCYSFTVGLLLLQLYCNFNLQKWSCFIVVEIYALITKQTPFLR